MTNANQDRNLPHLRVYKPNHGSVDIEQLKSLIQKISRKQDVDEYLHPFQYMRDSKNEGVVSM